MLKAPDEGKRRQRARSRGAQIAKGRDRPAVGRGWCDPMLNLRSESKERDSKLTIWGGCIPTPRKACKSKERSNIGELYSRAFKFSNLPSHPIECHIFRPIV